MTRDKNFYSAVLADIKGKLDVKTASVLVGAGFSKNFNNEIFPDWYQLIFDMVKDGEEERLKDEFELANKRKKTPPTAYQDFLHAKIWAQVQKNGPLQCVSDFIKRKGFREAADIRIEQKTPVIDIENGVQYISFRKPDGAFERRLVQDEEMRVHRKLLNLPWNNIYTTNYDNLLENSVDPKVDAEVNAKKEQLKQDIIEKSKAIQEKDDELNLAKDELVAFEESLNEDSESTVMLATDPGSGSTEKQRQKLQQKINNVKREINYLKSAVKKLSETLAYLNRIFTKRSVIKHSSDLAIKKDGNIIKIHGSIRTGEDKEDMVYGFDNDAKNHYIISQEDFDNYPERHAAFTQLMRISLLQESFCLLGFSGIDPNFLAWIGWVRDIIERKEKNEEINRYKIYMIDVKGAIEDSEHALFYENHRIVYIPLANPNCLEFLEKQVGRILGVEPTAKDYIELFLDYLSEDRTPNERKTGFEIFQIDEYKRLWDNLPRMHEHVTLLNFPAIFARADQIDKLKKYNRIPLIDSHTSTTKYHFLRSFNNYIDLVDNNEAVEKQILKVAIAIIDDQLLPHRMLFTSVPGLFLRLSNLARKISTKAYEQFLLFDLKSAIWDNDLISIERICSELVDTKNDAVSNEIIYLKAQHAFFNFKFDKGLEILDAWKPGEYWVIKKAGLLSIVSPEKAFESLTGKRQETVQESLFQLEMLSYLSLSKMQFEQRTEFIQQIKVITNQGLESIQDKTDYFIQRLNKHATKIIPYGYDKFTNSRTIIFGGPNNFLEGLQLLTLLSETGFPLSIPGAYLEDFKDLHHVFEQTFKEYQFPTLFYIFQYSEEKAIMRMAQDYAYSDDLRDTIPLIFDNFTKLYLDHRAPLRFKTNMFLFLSEFVNVLEPPIWEEFYLLVWNIEKESKNLFVERHISRNLFLENGIRFIATPEIAAQLINDSLMAVISDASNVDSKSVIQYLYDLNFNFTLKKSAKNINKLLDKNAIQTLIDSIHLDIDLLFILGNISFALTKTQQGKLHRALLSVDTFNTTSERIWRIILVIGKGKVEIIDKVKAQILNSPNLWNAGFNEEGGLSFPNAFISLYKLRRFKKNYGIVWTNEELEFIFKKMETVLTKMEMWVAQRHDDFFEFDSIAEEMSWFVNFETTRLKMFTNFQDVKNRVNVLFQKEKQYETIIQGLLSEEKEPFTNAIGEVSYDIYNFQRFNENAFYIRTILNKIIFIKEPGLAAAISTIAEWMYTFRNRKELKKFQPLLELILENYEDRLTMYIDKPSLQESMIKLALALRLWKSKKPFVRTTLELLETSRFNSIKFNLKQKLETNID